jgi:hypothetical protein
MVKQYRCLVLFLILVPFFLSAFSEAEELDEGTVRPEVMQTVFSGYEEMHFTISWTGGIKIGDLSLTLKQVGNEEYEINARVTDYGIFKFFYPVDDTFVTLVRGAFKLPYQYDVLQNEGRGSVTRRQSLYDQDNMMVTYRKNDSPELVFDIDKTVHNEFSSFYITRSMDLEPGSSFVVPTFADKKVNEVKVVVKGREDINSPFGRVRTLMVMPLMKFKGLFDKDGDTVIWLTDDACRVPVKIRSKILIGSLTTELDKYTNSACERY